MCWITDSWLVAGFSPANGLLGLLLLHMQPAPFGAMGQKLETSLQFLFTANMTPGTKNLMSGLQFEWMRCKPENSIHDTSLSSSEFCPTHYKVYPIKYACNLVVLCLIVFGYGYMVSWPILLRVTWLALGQSSGCLSTSQVTLKINLTGTKSQLNRTMCEPCANCYVLRRSFKKIQSCSKEYGRPFFIKSDSCP